MATYGTGLYGAGVFGVLPPPPVAALGSRLFFPDLVAEIAFETNPASAYLRTEFVMIADANAYLYRDMTSVSDYVVQAGDYLEYDLWHEQSIATIAVQLFASDGSSIAGVLDQNGLAPFDNLNAYALNQWYHRKFSLSSLVGKTLTRFDLACERDTGGTFSARFRGIRITDGFGTTRKHIWHQVQPLPTYAPDIFNPVGQSYTGTRVYEEPVFEDVTLWLLEAHPRHGRKKPLERVAKGQMTAVLDNADGRFDSENTASPYWPNVVAGRRMRVRVRRYWELVRSDSPKSLWRLSETIFSGTANAFLDTTGAHHGSITSGPTSPTAGQNGIAYGDWEEVSLGFDGGDLVSVGDFYRFDGVLSFSVGALVRTGVLAVDGVRRHVISHLRTDGGGRQGWALTVLDKKIRISRFRNGVEQFVQHSVNLADNTSYTIHATYAGAGDQKLRLYLNGALVGSADSTQAIIAGASNLTIGNIPAGTEGWLGHLSNVAVWDIVLTPEQIDAHYDKSFFAYWGNIWDGQIEDWPVNWKGRLPEVSVTVDDALGALEPTRVSGFRVVEFSGARIGWALDQANFPGARRIDPGRSLVEESSSVAGTLLDNDEGLDHIQTIAESELGVFFAAPDFAVVFHDRLRRPLSASALQGTFTNDPVYAGVGALLALDIVPNKSTEDVLNDIRLRPVAATTDAVVVDLDSQLNGIHALSRTVWLTSLTECQNQAEWMMAQFREAQLRFDELVIDPKRDLDGLVPQVLRREISDRIRVVYRMPTGEPGLIDNTGPLITKDCHIEEVAHDIVSRESGWSWETRYALSSAETQAYWILGDASNSLLGQSTVLGY